LVFVLELVSSHMPRNPVTVAADLRGLIRRALGSTHSKDLHHQRYCGENKGSEPGRDRAIG
jgi:hypothetical protein